MRNIFTWKRWLISAVLLFGILPYAIAQQSIKGVVNDMDGAPLVGVTVFIAEDPTVGTTTDVNGAFNLNSSIPSPTLNFSFIGYESQQVKVDGNGPLNIVLKSADIMMKDIVVVGYGVQKKANVAGAISSVNAETFESRPITSIGAGLQGVIGNLNVTTGGRPNDASTFNIRGTTSINGGSPLIILDNVSVNEAELSRLNPADIANVSVIKDASAAAIYGARASFGVILITTKSANTQDLKIDAHFNQSYRQMTRIPQYCYDPYIQVTYKDIMGDPWYDMYNELDFEYAKKVRENPSKYPAAIVDPNNPEGWEYYGRTNWNDIVFKPAATSTFNMSVSQKTEKAAFYLSGEYMMMDGSIKLGNETYDRANLRSKVDFNLTKWAKLTSNLSYTSDVYDTPYYAKNEGYATLFYQVNKTNVLYTPYNPDGTYSYYGADILGHLESGGRHVKKNSDFMLSFGLDVSLLKNIWTVKADVTVRKEYMTEKNSEWSQYYGAGPNTPHAALDGGVVPWVEEITAPTTYNAINVYTNFNKDFGKHHLEMLLGFNQENNIYDYVYAKRDNLVSTNIPSLGLASGNQFVDGSSEDWAVRGAFYRINYNYDGRYILEANGRYDGSSRFPKNSRFDFFPSFSAAYVVSNEKFFKPLTSVVSHFKIRGSIGMLGNQNVGAYDYLATLPSGPIGQIIGGSYPLGVWAPGLVSSNLTWEKVTTRNLGIDMNFLRNRITASFDIYRRDTRDMLVAGYTLPGVLGTASPRINGADLKTNGWELTLGYNDSFEVLGSPLNIGANFTIANNKAVITKYENPNGNLDDLYVGKELGEIWGLTTAGFFRNAEEIAALDQTEVTGYLDVRPIEPGDLKFVDLDGNKVISKESWTLSDHGDYSVIGNSLPRLPYSFRVNLDWKGFDLSLFFQGIGQMDYYPPAGQFTFWGVYAEPWTNVLESNLDHWTPENPNAYFPRLKSYIAEKDYWDLGIAQTRYLQDASYLRLRNLTFGYTLPRKLTSKIGIEKLRVYFSGENLALWTDLSENLDPENLSGTNYPINKTYSFGIDLNF